MTIHVASLDATGLTVLTEDQALENLQERVRTHSDLGTDVETGAGTLVGQVLDAVARGIGENYGLLQQIYDARDPDAAEGVNLDNLSGLAGVIRKPATFSTVTLTLTGTPSTVIPAGSRARVPDGPIFAIDAEATIGGGGSVTAAATATVAGPQSAAIGAIDEIVDAVAGWTGVTNAASATEGRAVETDTVLRARRERDLNIGGNSRPAAIRAKLEALDFLNAAAVLENTSLVTDADGVPGKAYRPIVFPSGLTATQEDTVAETIWEAAGAGIEIDGAVSRTITDDQGFAQTIKFSYASSVVMYTEVDYHKNSDFPANGETLIEEAVQAYDDTLSVGDDVKPLDMSKQICAAVEGIDHLVIRVKAGGAPGPTDTVPVSIDVDEIADTDSNITVTDTTP